MVVYHICTKSPRSNICTHMHKCKVVKFRNTCRLLFWYETCSGHSLYIGKTSIGLKEDTNFSSPVNNLHTIFWDMRNHFCWKSACPLDHLYFGEIRKKINGKNWTFCKIGKYPNHGIINWSNIAKSPTTIKVIARRRENWASNYSKMFLIKKINIFIGNDILYLGL